MGCPLGRGHAFPIRLGLWKIGSPSELSQGPLTDLAVLLTGITQPTQVPPPQTPIWLSCTWPAWHGDAGPSTWVPSYLGSGADQQEAITSAYNNQTLCVCVCVCVCVCSRGQGQSWPPRPQRPAPADGEAEPGTHWAVSWTRTELRLGGPGGVQGPLGFGQPGGWAAQPWD